jgi:phosphate starvation-inducible PhoH-like protein
VLPAIQRGNTAQNRTILKKRFQLAEKSYNLQGFSLINFLGSNDSNLRLLQRTFAGRIVVRGEKLTLIGSRDEILEFEPVVKTLIAEARGGRVLDEYVLSDLIEVKQSKRDGSEALSIKTPKKRINPKTEGQRAYLQAMEENDVVICIGPSGTGKTYLAVAKAVQSLIAREFERIVLVRPAVEAGESLGFLPGDFMEKINPYLRPLYDALMDMVPRERLSRLYDTQTVEVAPLAFMRGRTLNDSFVILDEAQNTTSVQMKMFLTRLGSGSNAVVTGDITQIDLPDEGGSGLVKIQKVLAKVKSVKLIHLTRKDVVRRKLVQKIVEAYERYANEEKK